MKLVRKFEFLAKISIITIAKVRNHGFPSRCLKISALSLLFGGGTSQKHSVEFIWSVLLIKAVLKAVRGVFC